MAGGKASKRRVEIAERSVRAMQLRKTGATYRAIASAITTELGINYTEAQAHKDITRELGRINQELAIDAECVRTLELERLDAYLLSIARDVQKGDLSAIDRALKISERRCKILGIDAPIELRVREMVAAHVESQFNLFFEAIAEDSLLTTEQKARIFEIAANLSEAAANAEAN